LDPREIRAGEAGLDELGPGEVGARQVGIDQRRLGEVRAREPRSLEDSPVEPRPGLACESCAGEATP
jgi:hypothetical protein